MLALPQQYDQATTEKKWQKHWLEAKTYAWDSEVSRENSYVIDTPPPTVSGTLHMGHVFSYTQADFIARFQRMNGKNVFYPMGFDDNGLPTERLVEKTKKIRAVDMSREKFIEECLGVSEEARKEFRALFESIALSVDWAQEYHTISDDSRRLSQLSFLDLVEKGHAYRAQRPFYWDPVDQTAIASAEIEDKELPSFANEVVFRLVTPSNDGVRADPVMRRDDTLIIMTTRPELLPACVALFCHPEDARYTKLHGKQAEVPLFGFSVPILTDDTVDMEKGTGLMMCCTFGDDADIAKWQKHKLPVRLVINKFGKMDADALTTLGIAPALVEMLQGKKISNTDPKHLGARQTVIAMLEEAGLLVSKKPITHAVKCAERSGAPLEILPTSQWFVKVTDKKEALKQRAAESNWNPDWMRLRIEQWIDGLNQDWCISRQRYFGVPFPVWYEVGFGEGLLQPAKPVYADSNQLPVNPLVDLPAGYQIISDSELAADHISVTGGLRGKIYRNPEGKMVTLIPDLDVMDTWATSSISPQLSAGAISLNPESRTPNPRFEKLFPADLRPQAHEIIRTWAFYTIVKAHLHNDSVPWHNLMISGWCLAEDKSKMSKSKGNVVTPVALIEERGTDAVRYWAGTSRLGADTAFSPDLLKIGKKLVGKLWNATQFAAIHLSKMTDAPATPATDAAITEAFDKWILCKLGKTVAIATISFKQYEYAEALDLTNQFFWTDFCDNYLEIIKKRVYNEGSSFSTAAQQSAVRTLYYVLDGILKLYAPFIPHVTEELYSSIFVEAYSLHGSIHAMNQWPKHSDYLDANDVVTTLGGMALFALDMARKKKSEAKLSIKFPVKYLKIATSHWTNHAIELKSLMSDIQGAGNIQKIEIVEGTDVNLALQVLEVTLADEADAA